MRTTSRVLSCSAVFLAAASLSVAQADAQNARARRTPQRATAQRQTPPQQQPQPQQPQAQQPQAQQPPQSGGPDIEIEATVHADSLRFDIVPKDIRVTFENDTDSVFEFDRGNLPDPVEPGVTYHDVTVRLKISSKLLEKLLQDPSLIQPGVPAPPQQRPPGGQR